MKSFGLGTDRISAARWLAPSAAAAAILLCGAINTYAAEFRAVDKFTSNGYAVLKSSAEVRGLLGISTGTPYAALDIVSTGTASDIYTQIWRDGGGAIKASMSAVGYMQAVKFIGDGSSLTGVSSDTLKIGDAYGGGIVFWVDAKGQQALIAPTADQSAGLVWAPTTGFTGAQLDGIGAGKANTVMITTTTGPGSYAARLCANYAVTVNGVYYDDWYLPSIAELQLLYAQKAVVGGFNNADYWSSTEYTSDATFARAVYFPDGSVDNMSKASSPPVRCVRGGPVTAFDYSRDAETVRNGAYVTSTQTFTGANTFTSSVTVPSAGSLYVNDGSAGQILSKTAAGNLQWTSSTGLGDNLGSHIATATLNLALNNIVNVSSISFMPGVFLSSTAAGSFGVYVSSHILINGKLQALGGDVMAYSVGQAGFHLYNGGGVAEWFIRQPNSTSHNLTFSKYVAGTYTDYGVIDTSGRFGIGTTNPGTAGLAVMNGNVGIYTTSPQSQLSLGALGYNTYTYNAADQLQLQMYVMNTDNFKRYADIAAIGSQNGTAGGGVLRFITNPINSATGVERMRIERDGKVGIGNTVPSYMLTVSSGAGESGTVMAVSTGATNLFWVAGDGAHAVKFFGNGSGLTGLTGDNLGNHTATQGLDMAQFPVVDVSSLAMVGDGLRITTSVFTGASGIFVSTSGQVMTMGVGNGTALPNARGIGAVDLQTYRTASDQVASGRYSTIAGGVENVASGEASLLSGWNNTASGADGVAIGGYYNTAGGEESAVVGGADNVVSGRFSAIVGGDSSDVSGDYSVTAGGSFLISPGTFSFVGGGYENRTYGYYTAVVGGEYNWAYANESAVVGGNGNGAYGEYSAVLAGLDNRTYGFAALALGGDRNYASGDYSLAAGRTSSSTAMGSFTWADSQGGATVRTINNVADRTLFKNRGGFMITGSTNTYMVGAKDRGILVTGDGLVGISTGVPYAALDVVSTGTADNTWAQIWRNGSGVEVASMTSTGKLYATLAVSGSGDNLGNHTATQGLDLAQFPVVNVSSLAMAGDGIRIATSVYAGASGIFISTSGQVMTVGLGNGDDFPDPRGIGAVDLQTYRYSFDEVASGPYSVVAGGQGNKAIGQSSVVSGGEGNTAVEWADAVLSGSYNTASGGASTVAGGYNNYATMEEDVVSGGDDNTASGGISVVAGGSYNTASGTWASVGGGGYNEATAGNATIAGGYDNHALGPFSAIPGGRANYVTSNFAFAAGYLAQSTSSGTFTWADSQGVGISNNVIDRTVFKSRGGFKITGQTGVIPVNLAMLEVVSTGTLVNQYVQIWRNSAGTIVSSMTSTGVLYPQPAGAAVPDSVNLSTINATASTPYGGVHITSNVIVSGGLSMTVSTDNAVSMLVSTGTGVNDYLLKLSSSGVLYAKAGVTYAGDLAEMYPALDDSAAADVVMMDAGGGAVRVRKALAGGGRVLGVVSTRPGVTIGNGDIGEHPGAVPVALSGRVPVKVSAENGRVKAGDFLGASSVPGHAAKAARSGMVIGMALEDQAPGAGYVLCFVNPQYWVDPSEFEDLKQEFEALKAGARK